MKMNDFYEVDGCTEFVPVTISEVYDDGVIVTVNNAKRNCMLAVEEVYKFLYTNLALGAFITILPIAFIISLFWVGEEL